MASKAIASAVAALGLGFGVLAGGVSAAAAAGTCASLSEQLAGLDRNSSNFGEGDYRRRTAVQQRELRRARRRASRLGCDTTIFSRNAQRCEPLARQIVEMSDNLRELQARLEGHGEPDRAELTRRYESRGCTGPDRGGTLRTATASSDGLHILGSDGAEIFTPLERAGDANHIVLRPMAPDINPNGAYRTMCVRTCDGYYFPISYAVTPAQFTSDEEACRQRCPGTDVRLYYHRVPEEDAEEMVSVSEGAPYTALPHAFAYRRIGQRIAGACTCHQSALGRASTGDGSRGFEELAPPTNAGNARTEGSFIDLSTPAPPSPNEAQQTTQPQKSEMPVEREKVDPPRAEAPDQPVRLVGPRFFPAPSGAEVLRVPGPQPAR